MMELYERYKDLLFRLAYQLTGSVSDAEDAVQDVFVKAQGIEFERLQEPKAYLCRMVTNRCLDLLKSARFRRESYVGPWLPEPVSTADADSLEEVVRNDLLSYAMLALLERLSPAERAVFVLREAFAFDYSAIAEVTGKSETYCRKLMSRARGKMGISEEELIGAGSVEKEWVQRFLAALSSGEVDTVLSLLAEDAVLVSDGGGKVSAAVHPIEKKEFVARFLFGIVRKASQEGDGDMAFTLEPLNGQTGLVIRQGGVVTTVVFFRLMNGLLQNIYFVRNPDKLAHI